VLRLLYTGSWMQLHVLCSTVMNHVQCGHEDSGKVRQVSVLPCLDDCRWSDRRRNQVQRVSTSLAASPARSEHSRCRAELAPCCAEMTNLPRSTYTLTQKRHRINHQNTSREAISRFLCSEIFSIQKVSISAFYRQLNCLVCIICVT